MNLFVNAPFEWCQMCPMFRIKVVIARTLTAEGIKNKENYRCENLDICIAANKAREEMEKEKKNELVGRI